MSLIDTPRGLRLLTPARQWAVIAVIRVEAVVHVAVETFRPVKPRTSAHENASGKPFWPVVTGRSAIVGSDVVVTIGTLGCYSDVDADAHLRVDPWGEGREAASSYGS